MNQHKDTRPKDSKGNVIHLDNVLVAHNGNGGIWRYKVIDIDHLQGSMSVQIECLDPVESGFERRWLSRHDLWRAYEIEVKQ